MRLLITDNQSRAEFIRKVSEVPLDGKRKYIAEFKVFRRLRSLPQCRLYFAWLRCIHDETGQDVEDLHQYFKDKYLSFQIKLVLGEQTKITKSTADLDTKEFTEYLERIRVQMLEAGIFLPQPGESAWDDFYTQYGIK